MGGSITRPKAKGAKLPVSTGTRGVVRLTPMRGELFELEDLAFHPKSCVPLPEPEATPGEGPSAIAFASACLSFARLNPELESITTAHLSSDEGGDLALSAHRAAMVHALVKGDRDAFAKHADAKHVVADYQVILRWVARIWGWPCDPGQISGKHDADTDAALRRFQEWVGQELDEKIGVDGSMGPKTWGAMYMVYERALLDVMQIEIDWLKELRSKITPMKPQGCGDNFPIANVRPRDYRSTSDRRAEMIFFAKSDEPKMDCHPSAKSCLKDKCELHNARAFRITHQNVPPRALPALDLRLAITDVAGLYEPGYDDRAHPDPIGDYLGSGYHKGYKSEDDRGRIFSNTIARTDPATPWKKIWKKDSQFIELTVEITAQNGEIPHGLRVEWEWEDPDDKSDEQMHDQAAAETDPNDHGWTIPLPHPDDNIGVRDWPKKDAGPGAAFEEMKGFGKMDGASEKLCHTAVVDGVSKVRLHVTNCGGDNFRVSARVKDHPMGTDVLGDSTGVMTVWKRIDLEYRVMTGATTLPVDRVQRAFERVFVQMDVHWGEDLPDKEFIAEKRDDYHRLIDAYVNDKKNFTHKDEVGWFFLASAKRAARDLGERVDKAKKDNVSPAYDGPVKIVDFEYDGGWKGAAVEVDALLPENLASMVLGDVAGGPDVYWGVSSVHRNWPSAGKTTIALDSNDANPHFPFPTGKDTGSLTKAYEKRRSRYPRHEMVDGAVIPGGLGYPENAYAKIFPDIEGEIGGTSPNTKHGGKAYFAGKTVVLSSHPTYKLEDLDWIPDFDELTDTMVHELGHAFGFPHMCGHHSTEHLGDKGCVMNYFWTWTYKPGTLEVERFTTPPVLDHFCARHASGIRRVSLEDNPALWKW